MLQLSGPSQNPCLDTTAEEEVACLQCKQTFIYPVILYMDILKYYYFLFHEFF